MKARKCLGSNRELVAFLYVLARDHLTMGQVESIMEKHVEKIRGQDLVFDNHYLAQYVEDLSIRLGVKP